MKKSLAVLLLFLSFSSYGQPISDLYCLITKINPSSGPFFSSKIKIGVINTSNGIATDTSSDFSENSINATGGAFDSVNNKMYIVSGQNTIMTFDALTGQITEVPIVYSDLDVVSYYFDNVSFSNSDSSLYGLLRLFGNNNNSLGMFFSKINTVTGVLTKLSQNSVGNGYQLAGTAIDPELMVYYYKSGPKFDGIDLYNGTIYSQPDVTNSANDFDFANFTYNCADNTIYGLSREMTTIQQPNAPPGVFIQYMRLAKIDPSTGVVTRVSENILPNAYYSINAGSTIDPESSTYYFSDNAFLYAISLETGMLISSTAITFDNGDILGFLSNMNECFGASPTRLNPNLGVASADVITKITISPNPTNAVLTITSDLNIDKIAIFDVNGRQVKFVTINTNSIDVSALQAGVYFAKVTSQSKTETIKFIKK